MLSAECNWKKGHLALLMIESNGVSWSAYRKIKKPQAALVPNSNSNVKITQHRSWATTGEATAKQDMDI
jgi:hypothetical protein